MFHIFSWKDLKNLLIYLTVSKWACDHLLPSIKVKKVLSCGDTLQYFTGIKNVVTWSESSKNHRTNVDTVQSIV